MTVQLESLRVTEQSPIEADVICLNEYGDRRYVFRAEDPRHPHIKRTAFQGLTLYGEWIELFEVTEEKYKGQNPLYTLGIHVIDGPSEDGKGTTLTKMFYGNARSGWEEGWRTQVRSNVPTTFDEMREMKAQILTKQQLPQIVDTEATVRAFFQQIEANDFLTPALFVSDYLPEKGV
ncbi:hypothetical protein IPM65_06475 [Candidatus Roizmanbacteria bacterium]|nr:MAG: hypothetical protein IPM65_06475 [Candidatus Roizmanbacteria bacterium]